MARNWQIDKLRVIFLENHIWQATINSLNVGRKCWLVSWYTQSCACKPAAAEEANQHVVVGLLAAKP